MFINYEIVQSCGWQAFERIIARLLIHKNFSGVRVVGGTGDKGADIIAQAPNGTRWLIQAKYWAKPVPESELQRTLEAARLYKASIAVVVALRGVDDRARAFQAAVVKQGRMLTVWGPSDLITQAEGLPKAVPVRSAQGKYQEAAIESVCDMIRSGSPRAGMVVMATGLGKTFVAAESIRRCSQQRRLRVLILAHTNQLVLQLEKAFWPFIGPAEPTCVWYQHERPSEDVLERCRFVFASRDTVANYCSTGNVLAGFDLVLIDECHHAHTKSSTYQAIIGNLRAGAVAGPQLLGLTATPFLVDADASLAPVFGATPLVSIDMISSVRLEVP